MRIPSSRRVLRAAALIAVPAAVWAFSASVYAWEGVTITATADCNHKVVVTGTDGPNHDLATHKTGQLDVTGPNHFSATETWTWPQGSTGTQTIATFTLTNAVAGTYTVALHEDDSVNHPFVVPPSCPTPSPSPTPTPTPTPGGQGHATPGLPNTGAAPA